MRLYDALGVLSTEMYPPLHTLWHGCRHSKAETTVMDLAIEEPALHLYKAGKGQTFASVPHQNTFSSVFCSAGMIFFHFNNLH